MCSYTTFSLGNLRLAQDKIGTDGSLVATAEITNTGQRAGEEVGQLYVGALGDNRHTLTIRRPSDCPKPVQLGPGGATLDGSDGIGASILREKLGYPADGHAVASSGAGVNSS